MKILKSIGLYFVYPLFTFILGIFAHIGYLNYFYPNKYLPQKESYFLDDTAYEVSNTQKPITTCDTRYIIVELNKTDNTSNEIETKIPEKYMGMTRDRLEDALMEYQQNPTLEDLEKGFINIQLDNFSSQEVRISKTYHPVPIDKKSGYYLMVLDGKVVVMEEDKKTIYLTTDIYAEALSDSLKQELILGKFINDIEDLYRFLESYTS